jgi:SAM-dependent methyltransferase
VEKTHLNNVSESAMSLPSRESWFEVLVASLTTEQCSPLGEALPGFPSEQMQRNTTGLSSEAALRQAYAFYEDVLDAVGKAGIALSPDSRVLDFGFGWGRISRVFMRDVALRNIYGIDVDPEFVKLTQTLFDSNQFKLCEPFPPSAYSAETFDLVYAYSVFSHLSEEACQRWMAEFSRILKPGGVVVFTTRHESFFDFCAWAATQEDQVGYVRALGELFPDLDKARASYKAGQIVHASSTGVGGGGPRDTSFYGETWIPEEYVRTRFGDDLTLVASYFDGTRYDQACFALQRKH